MSAVESLKECNDRLSSLLADPHPGLWTWNMAVRRAILAIAKFAGLEPADGDS